MKLQWHPSRYLHFKVFADTGGFGRYVIDWSTGRFVVRCELRPVGVFHTIDEAKGCAEGAALVRLSESYEEGRAEDHEDLEGRSGAGGCGVEGGGAEDESDSFFSSDGRW